MCVVRTSFKSHWAEPYQKPCLFTEFITAFSRIPPEMFAWIPLQSTIGNRLRKLEIQILDSLQLGKGFWSTLSSCDRAVLFIS